jgi:hypothetical protein
VRDEHSFLMDRERQHAQGTISRVFQFPSSSNPFQRVGRKLRKTLISV